VTPPDPLRAAQELLHQDLEAESGRAATSMGGCVNPDKYRRARALFEQALAEDPSCEEAREGLAICDEMLTPYCAVQYMIPHGPVDLDPEALPAPATPAPPAEPLPPRKPWEVLRARRAYDAEGVRYTSQAFGEASARARAEWRALVDEALAALARGDGPPAEVRAQARARLEELQARTHRGWKGHGPEFLADALAALEGAAGPGEPGGAGHQLAPPPPPEE